MPAHKKKYYDVVTTFPNYDLHGAAAAGNIGLVTYAITHGQPINAVLGGLLPLHAAASGGSVDVVQLLIDHGADVNAPRMPSATGPPIGVGGAGSIVGPNGIVGGGNGGNDCGDTSSTGEKLHRGRLGSAGGQHHPPSSAVSAAARPGSANPQSSIPIGRRGSTPLHFAAALGHMDVLRLLLENGARPSAKDADKATPEMVARAAGRTRAAELLKEWEAHLQAAAAMTGTGTPRRSLENPQQQHLITPTNAKPSGAVSPDFKFGSENASTASLPLVPSPPAALSTSSLGRYPNQPGRRPSLPSIYESPPSTSYPRPGSSKRQDSEPATKPSSSKLPFSLRRPKSAGNKDKDGGRVDDDASSQISHFSSKTTDSKAAGASRLNRMFKRPNNANARPATASGALSTASSPTSPSPPVVGRSRSPSASKISEKGERSGAGGFFHGAHLPHLPLPHLPHLPRRDHSHAYQQSPHHLHPHHVSRDAISGPIPNGQSPSTGIPDIAHPEMSEPPLTSSTNYTNSPMYADVNTPSDELEEEDAMSKMLNLTPAEIQYARTRGALSDRLKSPTSTTRTAPAGQTSFGKKPSYSTLNHYPSQSGLSTKASAPAPTSYSTLPSPKVPRHRQHLGPGGGLTMTNAEQGSHDEFGQHNKPSRTDTPVSYNSSTAVDKLSPGARIAHPVPSLTSLNRQVRNMRAREGNGSISSLDSALTGTSGSQEMARSPLGGVDRDDFDYPSRTSPGGQDSPYYGAVGMLPLSDGRLISSRAQASELVEAHKKAIQTSHDQRVRARKTTGTSSRHGHTSPLSDAPYTEAPEQIPSSAADAKDGSSPNHDTEDGNTSLEEEDVTSLREKLAALGETLQIERQLAEREQQARKQQAKWDQQARRWNRESALDDGEDIEIRPGEMTIGAGGGNNGFGPASSIGASVFARNEMLDEYLRTGEQPSASESERVKKRVPAAPVRDVFGRPVTPKQKEGRPPTPKETRPTTPKNVPATPVSSRYQDAPRENRVLPPASKTPPVRSATHLTLQQTRAISKSDLALGSHVNKDAIIRDMDLQGRERAWTTTEVRPRAGPASVSRPSTAGSRPANGGLKIEITQTMATPTGGNTPLKGNSPMEPSPRERPEQETIQSRRRTSSQPLRIDAQAAQERSRSKESSEGGPQPSPNTLGEDRRQRSSSKPRRAATPTKDQPSSRRASPGSGAPAIAVVPPSENPGFASFLSVSSGAQESPVENTSQPVSPVPPLPSALALHHQLMRNHEEAMKMAENSARQASPSPPSVSHGGDHMASAAERRLGLGVTGRNEFGHDSVRSFNEEKPADGPRRLWSTESRESDTSAAKSSAKTKITGFISRLKGSRPA